MKRSSGVEIAIEEKDALTEQERCRIANPRPRETVREFEPSTLRQICVVTPGGPAPVLKTVGGRDAVGIDTSATRQDDAPPAGEAEKEHDRF